MGFSGGAAHDGRQAVSPVRIAIDNNLFGLQQFVKGKPIWESYLKGEEPDPKVAMTKVQEAVQAEIKKG